MEKHIRIQSSVLAGRLSARQLRNKAKGWNIARLFKKHRKRFTRYALLTVNIVLLVGVVAFVAQTPVSTSNKQNSLTTVETEISNPLDQISSADIAVHVAQRIQLAEVRSVTNNADTINAQLTITPADEKVVAKPQVVATALKSRRDIQQYTVKPGDTISSIAAKFGITSDSVRWSNNLSGNVVQTGTTLTIPPVNGIVHVLREGDTVEALAERYRVSRESIITFNDAEVTGLPPAGEKIVIPEGIQPLNTVRSTGIFGGSGFAWGGSAVYGYNGYDFGYCTWWAAKRRAEIGRPIPSNLGNASTWKVLAQRAGLAVGNVPRTGAIMWVPPADYYGHVSFVERVDPSGMVHISEMNVVGWNRVSYRTLDPAEASRYSYIY